MLTVTQFLNERMDGILRTEKNNEGMVHLYHVNDCWSAVEKSAYFLTQLTVCEVITLLVKEHETMATRQIVLASVSEARLNDANKNYSVIWRGDDYLVLRPKNIPTRYTEWHQENIVDDIEDDDLEDL